MSTPHFLTIAMFALALAAGPAAPRAHADDPVESGGRALSDRFPWYDSDTDSLRRINVRPDNSGTNRSGSTTGSGGASGGSGSSGGGGSGSGGSGGGSGSSGSSPRSSQTMPSSSVSPAAGAAIQMVAWTVLAVVLIVIIAGLIYAFLNRESKEAEGDPQELPEEDDTKRVEALPFTVRRPSGNLLDEARRCWEAGNYSEAIIYLYSHQLVELDRHQWIQLARGKTNRQYLWELGSSSTPLRNVLEQTMMAFEDVFFGKHPIDRPRFESCWSQVEPFQRLVERKGAA